MKLFLRLVLILSVSVNALAGEVRIWDKSANKKIKKEAWADRSSFSKLEIVGKNINFKSCTIKNEDLYVVGNLNGNFKNQKCKLLGSYPLSKFNQAVTDYAGKNLGTQPLKGVLNGLGSAGAGLVTLFGGIATVGLAPSAPPLALLMGAGTVSAGSISGYLGVKAKRQLTEQRIVTEAQAKAVIRSVSMSSAQTLSIVTDDYTRFMDSFRAVLVKI